MMRPSRRRLYSIASIIGVLAVAAFFILNGLKDYIIYFYNPSDIADAAIAESQKVRIGGLVRRGSVVTDAHQGIRFQITDMQAEVTVSYSGPLPDLFREGQGVVAEGYYDGATGQLTAERILAKHDETYRPPSAADDGDEPHGVATLVGDG